MIIILTIKRRMYLALKTKKSLIDVGVPRENIYIIEGYDRLDYPDMKRPHLLLIEAFFDKWLPVALDLNEHCYYVECGTLFKENPYNIEKQFNKINWLGYIRHNKSYTTGTKCLYIPRQIIQLLYYEPPEKKKYGHIDRVIRNYGEERDILFILERSITFLQDYESDWGTKH